MEFWFTQSTFSVSSLCACTHKYICSTVNCTSPFLFPLKALLELLQCSARLPFYSWLFLYLQNVCILCLSLFSDRLLRAAHTISTEEPQILMHFRKASSNFSLQHSALWPEYSSGLFPQAFGAGTYWRHCRVCAYQIQQNLLWPQNSWNTEVSRETWNEIEHSPNLKIMLALSKR